MTQRSPSLFACALIGAFVFSPRAHAQADTEHVQELVAPGMWGGEHVDERGGSWFTPGNATWPTQLVRTPTAEIDGEQAPMESGAVVVWPVSGQIDDAFIDGACADREHAWDPLMIEFVQRRRAGFGRTDRCMPYTLDRLDQTRPPAAFVTQDVPVNRAIAELDVMSVRYRRDREGERIIDSRRSWTASWIDESTGLPDGVAGPFVEHGEYGVDGRLLRWVTMSNPVEGPGVLSEWLFEWDALGRPVAASYIQYWHPVAVQAGNAEFDDDRLRYVSDVTPHREQHFEWRYEDRVTLSVLHVRDGEERDTDEYVYAVAR